MVTALESTIAWRMSSGSETRPGLGGGRVSDPEDIRHAIVLSRAVTICATALAVLISVVTGA
jgi:cobalamin biosynthesis protein CobD/CbiB